MSTTPTYKVCYTDANDLTKVRAGLTIEDAIVLRSDLEYLGYMVSIISDQEAKA